MNPLFEELKSIFESDNINVTNPYMINRLLSFYMQSFKTSEVCNQYINRIPNELLASIYSSNIKKQKAPFIRYPKIPKMKEPKLIKKICETFNCNYKIAKQIICIFKKMNINPPS